MQPVSAGIFLVLIHLLLPCVYAKGIDGKIKLRLYRKSSRDFLEADIEEGLAVVKENKGFKKELPIILIIHGMAMGADSHFVKGLIDAYVKRGIHLEYNIFAVDMPKLFGNNIFNNFYFGVLSNVEPAGDKIGTFLNQVIDMKLTSPEKINLVGYSIGAQVAGYSARLVLNTFGPVSYIAGLDPAGPGFHTMFGHVPRLTHVSQEDANVTHFFHTNSQMCGTMDRIGTADFVFNDGNNQPGCTRESSLDCSHSRIPYLYIEAVTHPKRFIGRQCDSWQLFMECQCSQEKTANITFPPDKSAQGIYYLHTNAESPFGKGEAGIQCGGAVGPDLGSEQVAKHYPFLPKLETLENYRRNQLSIIRSRKESDFNVHIMSGIKKFEDLQHEHSKMT